MDHNPYAILLSLEDSKAVELRIESTAESKPEPEHVNDPEPLPKPMRKPLSVNPNNSDCPCPGPPNPGPPNPGLLDPDLEDLANCENDEMFQVAIQVAEQVLRTNPFEDLIEGLLKIRRDHRLRYMKIHNDISLLGVELTKVFNVATGIEYQVQYITMLLENIKRDMRQSADSSYRSIGAHSRIRKMINERQAEYAATLVSQRISAQNERDKMGSIMSEAMRDHNRSSIRASMCRSAAISVSRAIDQLNLL
jgi:hypothetical protein